MASLAELLRQLESAWENLDEALVDLDDAEWGHPHGRHWSFRDVPYHLGYFDSEMIAAPIELGATASEEQTPVFATLAELNRWNDAKLDARPVALTPDELVYGMRRSRQRIRAALGDVDDSNLADPVLLRLPGTGWSSLEDALRLAQVHTWNHFAEAKLRRGLTGPVADAAVVHAALSSNLSSMPMVFKPSAATRPMVTQMSIGGPGGGDWVIKVAGGDCSVVEGLASQPDLTMRYRDADSFAAAAFSVVHPMRLMLSGRLRVEGLPKLGRFASMFATSHRS